jgi:ribosomal small subunit protein bTHX
MGKGDRKTRKGKTAIRSYGNVRPHRIKSTVAKKTTSPLAKKAPAAPKPAPVKKAPGPARKKP